MPKLLIQPNGLPAREILLRPGTNRIGRTADNDFQIEDESISSVHCEMILGDDEQLLVRDLGSTNGTFLNYEVIGESYFRPGQTLHIGNVKVLYAENSAAGSTPRRINLRVATVPQSATDHSVEAEAQPSELRRSSLRVAVAEPGNQSPIKRPPPRQFAPARPYRTFFQQLPSMFSYPFKNNGLLLLICGTVFFVILDFVGQFSIFLGVLAFGYLYLYMQSIVQSSAQGEEEMPGWPEFSDWWEDILLPALLLVMTFAVSFGPAVAMWVFLDADPAIKTTLGISLLLFGCCYLPMALLAVSMYDTFFALNPLLIIPSIMRIPLEYSVACLVLGMVLIVRLITFLVLDFLPIPLFPTVVGGFLSLYFIAVEMRILGVMYHTKKEELNWNI